MKKKIKTNTHTQNTQKNTQNQATKHKNTQVKEKTLKTIEYEYECRFWGPNIFFFFLIIRQLFQRKNLVVKKILNELNNNIEVPKMLIMMMRI